MLCTLCLLACWVPSCRVAGLATVLHSCGPAGYGAVRRRAQLLFLHVQVVIFMSPIKISDRVDHDQDTDPDVQIPLSVSSIA